MLLNGKLSAGHARTLITADDPEALAQLIVSEGMTVRQAEAQATAAKAKKPNGKNKSKSRGKDADTRSLQESLSTALGMKVEIDDKGGAGEVRISYKSLEQLDDICRRLSAT
jgi:ParB family chromosome partitioning protein